MIKRIIFFILFLIIANTQTFATKEAFGQVSNKMQKQQIERYNPTTLSDEKPLFAQKFKCIECSVITPLFTAVSSVAFLIYDYWRIYLIAIIGLCFGYWLLMQIYEQIKGAESYSQGDTESFLKTITKKLIKITAVICALAMTPQFFMKYTVEPIMYASTFVSDKFISISEQITGNKIRLEYTDEKYKLRPEIARKQAFSEEIKNNLLRITKNFSSVYTYGILLGQNITIATAIEGLTATAILTGLKYGVSKLLSLIPYVGPVLATIWEKFIDITGEIVNKIYIAIGLIGVGLVIIFFLIALRFFIVICGFIINIGLATILIPFAIAAWPFDELKSKLSLEKYIKDTFLGQIGNLAMFCIILAFCTYILEVFMMIEYISFNGETITIKEYIAMLDQVRTGNLLPNIISIIWQNIDLPIVFICFALCVLYLIENVPNYTTYFIAPVDSTASNLIWKNIETMYKKFASVGRTFIGSASKLSKAIKKDIKDALSDKSTNGYGNTNTKQTSQNMDLIKEKSVLSHILFNNKDIEFSMTGISQAIKSYTQDYEKYKLVTEFYPNINKTNKSKLKRRMAFEKTDLTQTDRELITKYINAGTLSDEQDLFNKLSTTGKIVLLKNELEIISKKEINFGNILSNNQNLKKPTIDNIKNENNKNIARDILNLQNFRENKSDSIQEDKLIYLFSSLKNIETKSKQSETSKTIMELYKEYAKTREMTEEINKISEEINKVGEEYNNQIKPNIKEIAITIIGEQINIYEQLIDYMEEKNKTYTNSNIGKYKKELKKLNEAMDNIEEELIDNQGNIEVYIEEREKFFKKIFKDRTIMEFLREKHLDKRQIRKFLSPMYEEIDSSTEAEAA